MLYSNLTRVPFVVFQRHRVLVGSIAQVHYQGIDDPESFLGDHDHNHDHSLTKILHLKSPQAHSGLQKQVLSLYRSYLRVAREKERTGAEGTVTFVRQKFRSEAEAVGRMEFQKIEYLLRKGDRQLKQFQTVKNASFAFVRK